MAASLRALIEGRGIERLVVVGVSAGGEAALAFGSLLGADAVLAFGPQTTIDPVGLAAIGDDRWDDAVGPLARARVLDPDWTDLRRALADRSTPPAQLYFDAAFGPDRAMMESNFPVDNQSAAFPVIWNAFKRVTQNYSRAERESMFFGTAQRVYRLAPSLERFPRP